MEVVKCKYTVYLDEAFYMWQLRHRLLYETFGTMTWRKREIYVYVLNKSKVLVIKGKYRSGLPMNEADKNQLQNDGWGCSLVSVLSSANICAVLHVVLMSRRQTVFTYLTFSYLYEQINKCWQSIIINSMGKIQTFYLKGVSWSLSLSHLHFLLYMKTPKTIRY